LTSSGFLFHNGSAVKLTAKVKIVVGEDAALLRKTLETANDACNWISEQAWEHQEFRQPALHKIVYYKARERFALSSQMVVRAIAKVVDAYKLDKKVQRTFRKYGAFPYDDRLLSWDLGAQTVSIWTTDGRKRLAYECGDRQTTLLASRQGESDLLYHRGKFYLAATCNVETPEPSDVDDFLGVDLGVNNIATDSDGKRYSGSEVKSVRHRQRRLRRKLQKLGTTSANRRLKKLAGKEQRFARHVNHVISKQIVADAKGTKRGIAVEQLTGIRGRIRVRREQRAVLHSWAFLQLKLFLIYKALLAGVPLMQVDPRNSSRECSKCGHIDKANRPSQSKFFCRSCGFTAHADVNAATNLRARGRAVVNRPNAAVGL
jgi:IS605 OrfB family transposase